jgi:hypothetical protein
MSSQSSRKESRSLKLTKIIDTPEYLAVFDHFQLYVAAGLVAI